MTPEASTVTKFVCYVVASFASVATLHSLIPPVALGCVVGLAAVVLVLIGLNKGELAPYAVVGLAAVVAFLLGV